MKLKLIFGIFVFILVSCAPKSIPTQTSTLILPTLTLSPTPIIEWGIVATPLNLSYSKSDDIVSIIDQLRPYLCIQQNLITVNPTPIGPIFQIPPINFTEIIALPEPNPRFDNKRTDNIDKSRTTFVEWEAGIYKLYIKDNKLDKLYVTNFEGRDLSFLQWINKDTITVVEQGHAASIVVAINVATQQYEYYGVTSGCFIVTPTP